MMEGKLYFKLEIYLKISCAIVANFLSMVFRWIRVMHLRIKRFGEKFPGYLLQSMHFQIFMAQEIYRTLVWMDCRIERRKSNSIATWPASRVLILHACLML